MERWEGANMTKNMDLGETISKYSKVKSQVLTRVYNMEINFSPNGHSK